MSFIKGENLIKTYGQHSSMVQALNRASFHIQNGEFVVVMGESGAGKSTLLSIMGAMNTPTAGSYLVDDIDVYALDSDQRADFRREYLGFVFQSFHLIPYLTVIENVMLPLTTAESARRQKKEMAYNALRRVGLTDKALRLPSQISGGEKERTAIARAIINNPPVLLADEPTGNLDTRNSQQIMELLAKLNQAGTTIVMVTHSSVCAQYARRVFQMRDGCLKSDTHPVISAAVG